MTENKSTILITCSKFITPWLSKELNSLGYKPKKELDTGVEITGSFDDCYHLNLQLRTAFRVNFLISEYKATTMDEFYSGAVTFPWEEWLKEDEYVSVHSFSDQKEVKDTRFPNMKLKDAIMDRLRECYDTRPDSGPDQSRVVIYAYWSANKVRLFIDTSGVPLNRRGYRERPHKAPMQQTLAAATIMATSWKPGMNFINPMCGSGTLVIEALMMATKTPPGIFRESFGFMYVKPFDKEKWQQIREEAKSKIIRVPKGIFVATDRDEKAIKSVTKNAENAGLKHHIVIRTLDFRETLVPEGRGVIMINPEYGARLGSEEKLEKVYKDIGLFFKHHRENNACYLFTGNLDLAKKIGIRYNEKIAFYNAKIRCDLYTFEGLPNKKLKAVSTDNPVKKRKKRISRS